MIFFFFQKVPTSGKMERQLKRRLKLQFGKDEIGFTNLLKKEKRIIR